MKIPVAAVSLWQLEVLQISPRHQVSELKAVSMPPAAMQASYDQVTVLGASGRSGQNKSCSVTQPRSKGLNVRPPLSLRHDCNANGFALPDYALAQALEAQS